VAHGAHMQTRPTTFARTIAFRTVGAIVVSNLLCLPFDGISRPALFLVDAAFLAMLAAMLAVIADRADARTNEMRAEGRRVLADHIRFAQELAASITHHPMEGADAQLIRVEIVRLFFAHASRLDVTEHEMQDLLRDTDPIVIADVVASLTKHHSPLMDDRVPWSSFAKELAKGHSILCHRPIEKLAWNRSLPPERALPEA